MEELLVEGAKLAIQVFFTNMRLAGKSEDEIDAVFKSEFEQFQNNRPEALEDTEPA